MSLNCSYDYDRLGVSENFRRHWFGVPFRVIPFPSTLPRTECARHEVRSSFDTPPVAGDEVQDRRAGRRVPRNNSEYFIL